MSLNKIRRILSKYKQQIVKTFGVSELGIFGSYVRGEQKKKSDLDVLVEFNEVPGLLKFLDLEENLTKLVGVKVDLVRRKGLKPRIG